MPKGDAIKKAFSGNPTANDDDMADVVLAGQFSGRRRRRGRVLSNGSKTISDMIHDFFGSLPLPSNNGHHDPLGRSSVARRTVPVSAPTG